MPNLACGTIGRWKILWWVGPVEGNEVIGVVPLEGIYRSQPFSLLALLTHYDVYKKIVLALHGCDKMPEIINLKGEKIYFNSYIQRQIIMAGSFW